MKYQTEPLSKFAAQIKFALENYKPHHFEAKNFDNILLCGLGGSGIAGRIVKAYFSGSATLPIEIISDYALPAYTGPRTLCLISSYSGDTEETLAMYDAGKKRKSSIVTISTGGEIGRLSAQDNVTCYPAEKGFSPRMALGYSLTYLLLSLAELFGADIREELEKASVKLSDTNYYINASDKIFQDIKEYSTKKIVVITDRQTAPAGLRFCQQVQENAKGEAFQHELPEANHNVIESYYGKIDSVFILLDSKAHQKTSLRFGFIEELLMENGCKVARYDVEPYSLQTFLDAIYTLDWLSLKIADYKGVNSIDIQNINKLKNFLKNQ